jgi:integrase
VRPPPLTAEALHLRVKDVDLNGRVLLGHHGKDGDNRVTMIPATLLPALEAQIERMRARHRRDLAAGASR